MRKHFRVFKRLSAVVLLIATVTLQLFAPSMVSAAQITARSLTLVGAGTTGGSAPGGVVSHQFKFTVPGGSTVGSILFQYCTTAADTGTATCVRPTGLNTTAATLSTQSGATGFTLVNTTNGSPYLTRPAALISGVNVVLNYQLDGVTNPTTTNQTFFVRISTFGSTDTTGTAIDSGTVAASTATPIVLTGVMPESLVFCTGATIGLTNSVPDCGTATAGAISFNQLFSPTDTATSTSQMAASTNAGSGYAITVNGPTLTSGANTISGMTTADLSKHGISQFGMNLKANTSATSTTPVGTEVAPVSNGTNYRGQAEIDYNTSDTFKFQSGNVVADSQNGGAGGSDAQIFTVSYIANVPGSQPAGTYTTTLTYICTPSF